MSKASFAARIKPIGKKIFILLRHVALHNGWVKLLALLISLVLWTGLISQDDTLTRDKTWQNVNVTVNGSDTLKRNGYIVVSDMEDVLSNVAVTAAVPQKQYESAEVSSYNIRIDLSRINGTGTQEVKILSTSSGTYGKVTNTVPSVLNVEVEEYLVRQRIPVKDCKQRISFGGVRYTDPGFYGYQDPFRQLPENCFKKSIQRFRIRKEPGASSL